jgi:hypothetical protein
MVNKDKIKEAIAEAKAALHSVEDPEYSLSFPIVLSSILSGSNVVVERGSGKSAGQDGDSEDDFKGLTGGLRLLIRDGFFKEGKSQGEILSELQRQGYHYPKSSLPPVLIGMVQKRYLTRLRGPDGNWRYTERK